MKNQLNGLRGLPIPSWTITFTAKKAVSIGETAENEHILINGEAVQPQQLLFWTAANLPILSTNERFCNFVKTKSFFLKQEESELFPSSPFFISRYICFRDVFEFVWRKRYIVECRGHPVIKSSLVYNRNLCNNSAGIHWEFFHMLRICLLPKNTHGK